MNNRANGMKRMSMLILINQRLKMVSLENQCLHVVGVKSYAGIFGPQQMASYTLQTYGG